MTPTTRRLLLGQRPRLPARAAGAFVAASSQYLSVASTAVLQIGDLDYWVWAWAYLTDKSAARTFVGKRVSGFAADFTFVYDNSADRLAFTTFNGTSAAQSQTADTFGSPPTSTWMGILGWHQAVSGSASVGIKVNNGTSDIAARTLTPTASAGTLRIGAQQDTPSSFMNGRVAGVVIGKSPPGGAGILASLVSEISAALYNGGKGRDPANLTSAERTRWGVTFGANFAGLNGSTCPDVIGGLTLTNTNGVTPAAGPGA